MVGLVLFTNVVFAFDFEVDKPFNFESEVLVGGNVSGSGTTDYVPVWTGGDTLGNSNIYQTTNQVNIIGNTTSDTDFCIVGGNCLSTASEGGFYGNPFNQNLNSTKDVTFRNVEIDDLDKYTSNYVIVKNLIDNTLGYNTINSKVWSSSLLTGSGATYRMPYYISTYSLGQSNIYYKSNKLGVGKSNPSATIHAYAGLGVTSLRLENNGLGTQIANVYFDLTTDMQLIATDTGIVRDITFTIDRDDFLELSDNGTNYVYVYEELNVQDDVDIDQDLNVDGDVDVIGTYKHSGTEGFTGSCINTTYSGGLAVSCND